MTKASFKAMLFLKDSGDFGVFWVLPTQMSFFHQFGINWLSFPLRLNNTEASDFLAKTCSAAKTNIKAYPNSLVQINWGRVAYISSQIFGGSFFFLMGWGGRALFQ